MRGGGRYLSINTFAPIFLNEKWKIENGKFLTVMLNSFQHLTVLEVKLSAYKTLKQVQGDKKVFPLQGGGCHEVTGGGSSRRESFLQQTFSHIFSQTLFTQLCKNFPFSIFNYSFATKYGGLAHA